ncbi:hypothetical protein LY76DRAFT_279246 [Colletotrichum caudatum]|nr:hypothetical protein LY76DRAFT_279246 [Colletotrichum caudatum]
MNSSLFRKNIQAVIILPKASNVGKPFPHPVRFRPVAETLSSPKRVYDPPAFYGARPSQRWRFVPLKCPSRRTMCREHDHGGFFFPSYRYSSSFCTASLVYILLVRVALPLGLAFRMTIGFSQ